MEHNTRRLVSEMAAGVVIYNLLLCIVSFVFCPRLGYSWSPVVLGLAIGMTANILMLIHIAVIAEKVLRYGDEQYANRTTVIHSMIRKVLFIVLLIILWNIPQVNLLAVIIGAMGLKAGAYLQPVIHRVFSIKYKRKEDVYGNDENANCK